jgi:hypothetical protein
MAPLADPIRLQAYNNALSNWMYSGYIQFELTEQSLRWLRTELDSFSLQDIKRLMFEHAIEDGGEIDEQVETREQWSDQYEYHYDLRFRVQDKLVYIETRLNDWKPFVTDNPWILVVNIHAP